MAYRASIATSAQHDPATHARNYHPATCARNYRNALIRIVILHCLAIPVRSRGL